MIYVDESKYKLNFYKFNKIKLPIVHIAVFRLEISLVGFAKLRFLDHQLLQQEALVNFLEFA